MAIGGALWTFTTSSHEQRIQGELLLQQEKDEGGGQYLK